MDGETTVAEGLHVTDDSAEQAMSVLEIPQTERQKYRDLLEQQP